MNLINWQMASNPANWLIVFLMLALGGLALLWLDKAISPAAVAA